MADCTADLRRPANVNVVSYLLTYIAIKVNFRRRPQMFSMRFFWVGASTLGEQVSVGDWRWTVRYNVGN